MKQLDCYPKSLLSLMTTKHYTINYYQREYRWQRKQIEELIDDLTSEFLNHYNYGDEREDIVNYETYFMGSIVIANQDNTIIDGQQRLTSLTLLMIYLNNRLKTLGQNHPSIDRMIYSDRFGKKSFNINIEERNACMNAIYNNEDIDTAQCSESVKNIKDRYDDIEELFSKDIIRDEALLHFCDWLAEKVLFIEIITTTEQDAYKIFVTMNDRGLNLTSTEMLKGYLLSEVNDETEIARLNIIWKDTIYALKKNDDKGDETFIKAWLRAQYAETKRDKTSGAIKEDFDLIAGPFHKWVRDEHIHLGLNSSRDYIRFIELFEKFAKIYMQIRDAENKFSEDTKYIYYNAQVNFTQQMQLLLAPICPNDEREVVMTKINLVSRFIDIYIISRATNYRSLDYSTIRDYIFNLTKEIRHSSVDDLKKKLWHAYDALNYDPYGSLREFQLNNKSKRYIKNLLARIIGYIEEQIGVDNRYLSYADKSSRNPFEIEHILANHYEDFNKEYSTQEEFNTWRNKIGALLLLRKSINASLGDAPYIAKLESYCGINGNIYSASLGKQIYSNNPRFIRFCKNNNLLFENYDKFGKEEIEKRTKLLAKLVQLVWNADMFVEK